MTVTTGSFPKSLWPGVKTFWGENYNEHSMECNDLFDIESSDKSYEEDVEATGTGLAPVKPEGSNTTYDNPLQGYTNRAIHTAYSLGVIVTREAMDDNLYEKEAMLGAKNIAFSMRQTKENVAANIYNNAFTSALAGDGQYIIDSDHTTRSGNQANLLTVAADLSEASLEDLCIQIANAKNNRGLRISLMPKKLIVPTALMFEAKRILGSDLQSGTANNDVNALKAMGIFSDGYTVNHYLTDSDAFFIRTDCRGMVGYQRTPAEFTRDSDFDSENFKMKGYERYSFTCVDWRGIWGSPGV